MAADSLKFDDPRVERLSAQIRGKTYSYLLGKPQGPPKAHVVLVHGFPDLSWGWRHQVPYLMAKGLSVLVPDMLGYGGTDAPEELEPYSFKSVSADIAALVAHAWGPETKIILGGHDWGGAVIWRFAMWHPELLLGVFS
jgi:soluble epoxide hydrolase / lipid-phosphate phosphatase